MMYGREQLLWQKQVAVIGSIDLDSQIDEYHTDVAQFRHMCHRRSVRRQRFAPKLLFFVAADACSRSFCEFFSVANSFLSLNRMKITSLSNCFEHLSLARQFARQFASISSLTGVSLNTFYEDRGEKWSLRHQIVLFNVLNDEFVVGLIGLVSAHNFHILFSMRAPGGLLLCFRSMQFLPARRYASAGLCDSDVSGRLSVCLSVCHTPVLCLAERKQDRGMYTFW